MRILFPPLLSLVLSAWPALALAADGARVLFVDVGQEAAGGRPILDEAATQLSDRYEIAALGPSFAACTAETPEPGGLSATAQRLLDSAEIHFDSFEPDLAAEVLERAAVEIAKLQGEEQGPPLLRARWLYSQVAIMNGDDDRARLHLARIVELAPWWIPPQGALPPELGVFLEDARKDVVGRGAVILLPESYGPGDRVWIDGIALEPAQSQVPVSPGRHVVRLVRPGTVATAHALEVKEAQSTAVLPMASPHLDQASCDQMWRDLDGSPSKGTVADLQGLGRVAGVDLVVVAGRRGGDPDGAVRAAGMRLDDPGWALSPRWADATELADQLGGALRGAAEDRERAVARFAMVGAIGGSGRIVAPADELVASGGGLSAELGVGVVFVERIGLRALAGLDLHGPVALSVGEPGSTVEGEQSGNLIRVGAAVTPRIPLARGASIWLEGGGGGAWTRIETRLGATDPSTARKSGAWVTGGIGIDYALGRGFSVGPQCSYLHAWVPVSGEVGTGDGSHPYSSAAYRRIEWGLRLAAVL